MFHCDGIVDIVRDFNRIERPQAEILAGHASHEAILYEPRSFNKKDIPGQFRSVRPSFIPDMFRNISKKT